MTVKKTIILNKLIINVKIVSMSSYHRTNKSIQNSEKKFSLPNKY